jgi:CheY-like chemotaxis protein
MLADDNPNIFRVIASVFEDEWYELTTALGGKANIGALPIAEER